MNGWLATWLLFVLMTVIGLGITILGGTDRRTRRHDWSPGAEFTEGRHRRQ